MASHNQESTLQHLESLVSEVSTQRTLIMKQEEALKDSQENYTRLRSEHTDLTKYDKAPYAISCYY